MRLKDSYFEGNILSKSHVSRNGEVVELQHVWDALEACQVLLNLRRRRVSVAQLVRKRYLEVNLRLRMGPADVPGLPW